MLLRDHFAVLFACVNLVFILWIVFSAYPYRSNGIVGFSLFFRFVVTAAILPCLALLVKIPALSPYWMYGESLLTATAFLCYAFFNNFAITAFGLFQKRHRMAMIFFYLVPLGGSFIALSNSWTRLFFTDPEAARDVLFIMGGEYSGTLLLFSFSWCMAAMLVSLALVAFLSPMKVIREGRKYNLMMVASMFLPFFADFTHRYVPVLSGISLSYFAFSITAWIILQNYWGYLYHSRRIAAQVTSSHYIVFDTHGKCTDINNRARDFFKAYEEKKKPGMPSAALPTLDDLAEISGIPVDFLLTQDDQEFEFEERYYRIQGFPVRNGPIKANGRSFLITDLTSYKVLENSLAAIANHDALTQVYNRRFFFDYFSQLQKKHPGMDISILMIDADHFKNVNDIYGHLAGDEVLKTIAKRILGCLRTSDIICRFGGEEFLLLLSGTPSAGMKIVANRILLSISDNPIVFDMIRTSRGLMAMVEMNIKVTVSIGAYSTVLTGDTDLDQLVRCADAAMYCAKKVGRNRLVFANGENSMIVKEDK